MASTFTVERSRTIQAHRDDIRLLLTNFRNWRQWSPWEVDDTGLHRAYSGPQAGLGAHYAWDGNRQAGAAAVEIVGLDEEHVDIRLEFIKPYKSQNMTTFVLRPVGEGSTEVTWRMVGPGAVMVRLRGMLLNPGTFRGGDLDKGLARLDAAARRGHTLEEES